MKLKKNLLILSSLTISTLTYSTAFSSEDISIDEIKAAQVPYLNSSWYSVQSGFTLQRQSDYYVKVIIYPSILFASTSYVGFFIDRRNAPAR